LTPAELSLARGYAQQAGLPLLGIEEFRSWFFHYAYRLKATVVGFNLPFDLSRLAVDWAPARDSFAGGFSLTIWRRKEGDENTFRPRIRIKSVSAHGARIEFSSAPSDANARETRARWAGRFL